MVKSKQKDENKNDQNHIKQLKNDNDKLLEQLAVKEKHREN